MAKYRKRPIVVEAWQWFGPNSVPDGTFKPDDNVWFWDDEAVLHIPTLEGEMIANVGDWVIRGIAGELYPCRNAIFKKTYELVED